MKHARILLLAMSALVSACAPTKTESIPVTPPVIVTVTDAKPLVRAVEKQTDRLETRITDTAKKVDDITDSVAKSVDDAIRSGDVVREAQAKEFQKQIAQLKTMTDVAMATAKDLRDDAKSAHAELAKTADERDAAVLMREVMRTTMGNASQEAKVAMSRMDERRVSENTRATYWKKKALYTWAGLAAIGSILVAIKLFGHV